jgi:acetyl esterase/lipase
VLPRIVLGYQSNSCLGLAAYLYLLEEKHDPSTIILAGDSAGGGMVLSMLVTLRDQGIPLPAGAILISPWVDLTHSFPSLGGDGKMDYIPAHGFVHKPSISWPPPNADDILALESSPSGKLPTEPQDKDKEDKEAQKEEKTNRVRGFSINEQGLEGEAHPTAGDDEFFVSADGKYSIGPKSNPVLSVQLEDTRVEIKDQIQMYAANHLLTHPLVSPALQPTLGGLPPLLIQTGGGELLHDEQVYLAHKAAQPLAHPPPPSNHQTAEAIEAQIARYRPTNVQLQVWDDLCHVAPTLSFTRPAKYMYRSIAQFGAWALARAQKTSIDILDDDSISIVSHGSSESSATTEADSNVSPEEIKLSMPQSAQHVGFESVSKKAPSGSRVGKAGDPLPAFENHMIRQRIDRHGYVYPLAPKSDLVALNLPTIEIGVPKPGPVNKWMKAQKQWNGKFAKQKLKVQKKRLKDMQTGYERFEGEKPPPTALAGRRVKGMKSEKSKKKSWGMAFWSLLGSKHDKATLNREERADQDQANLEDAAKSKSTESTDGTTEDGPTSPASKTHRKSGLRPDRNTTSRSRSHSRVTTVTDRGQIAASMEDLNRLAPPTPGYADATKIAPERKASPLPSPTSELSSLDATGGATPGIMIDDVSRPQSPNTPTLIPETDGSSTRPTRGGIAYPFSLRVEGENRDVNPSMVTLQSVNVQEGEGLASEIPPPDVVGDTHNGEVSDTDKGERPTVERFVTAAPGDLSGETGKEEKAERPGVERFETAQEDLSVLANGNKS